jgi:hypothetical protein
MEPGGRNRRSQMGSAPKGRNKPKPLPRVATSCRSERMLRGVDGSSPSEGLHSLQS